ncbi:uncharacterized protein LOC128852387 [Cuculus canorus]|uniref:uncharacterized protein LOC128852387 n=1 Tax=Cuculus canorus TaxID=55661 RepID=UPI0023AAD741|nr:uncharacterized protein LOC128852387 [Cuculus canorus]
MFESCPETLNREESSDFFQQLCGVARHGEVLAMFHLRPGCLSAGNEMSTVRSICSESESSAGKGASEEVVPKDQHWSLVTEGNSVQRPKAPVQGQRTDRRQLLHRDPIFIPVSLIYKGWNSWCTLIWFWGLTDQSVPIPDNSRCVSFPPVSAETWLWRQADPLANLLPPGAFSLKGQVPAATLSSLVVLPGMLWNGGQTCWPQLPRGVLRNVVIKVWHPALLLSWEEREGTARGERLVWHLLQAPPHSPKTP